MIRASELVEGGSVSLRAGGADPLLSVVLPTHRRLAGGLLERAIRSVLSQSHRDLELIVVDDGSSERIGLARQGFFDAGGVVERATRPVTVTVDPLPDAAGFSGAVGRFRASASIDRDVVPLGEAATLRFRVEGTGNLKWIDRGPEVAVPGAKVFPPQAKSDLRATPEGITGSRTHAADVRRLDGPPARD